MHKTPSFDLTGKTALIPGGGGGIGFGCACALAEAGASVVITGRTESAIQEAAETINAAGYQASSLVINPTNAMLW